MHWYMYELWIGLHNEVSSNTVTYLTGQAIEPRQAASLAYFMWVSSYVSVNLSKR